MKINRMSEEQRSPEWLFDNKNSVDSIASKITSESDVNNILDMSCDINEDGIIVSKAVVRIIKDSKPVTVGN